MAQNLYQDALDLLTEDHRQIREMFREFGELSDGPEKRSLLKRVNAALTVHTEIERELFYPALRELLSETEILDEAEVEHELAETLIAELMEMDVHDAQFDSRLDVLIDSVIHHFAEEESEMFAQVRVDKPDLDSTAQEMRERKEELEAEFEPTEDEDEEDDLDDDERAFDE
jgi:hemerythrin superfamily protein